MEICIDNMLVYGKTEEEFLTNLGKVFQRAREWGLTFNPSKCRLGLHEFEFVGHIINAEGIKMPDEKKFKVVDFERPRTVKKMAVLNDIVIPSDKRELIQRVHGLALGHLGVDKTLTKIRDTCHPS